jgi:hypothetical protein
MHNTGCYSCGLQLTAAAPHEQQLLLQLCRAFCFLSRFGLVVTFLIASNCGYGSVVQCLFASNTLARLGGLSGRELLSVLCTYGVIQKWHRK